MRNRFRLVLASVGYAQQDHPYGGGTMIVAVPVPGNPHKFITQAAAIDGEWCPCCRPRAPDHPLSHPDVKRENQFVRKVHALACPRFYNVEGR